MIYRVSFLIFLIFSLTACERDNTNHSYDGKALLEKKCSQCHNLDMPPKTFPDEKAPPMMAVTFHVRDFMKVENPSEKRSKFVEFVVDYAINPSAQKSFCDKKSLEEYGLMPSQKGKVSPEELEAIAAYMYDHYDPQKFMKIMQEQARVAALPAWKRVVEQKNCLSCHAIKKDKLAPSFEKIAQKYEKMGKKRIVESIRQGSRGRWKGFKLSMPPFKDLSEDDLDAIADWVLSKGE